MNEPPIPGLWLAGDILLGVAILTALSFVLIYRRFDWRANEIGKFLMYFVMTIVAILSFSLSTRYIEIPILVLSITRMLTYTVIIVQLAILTGILIRYEKLSRSMEAKKEKEKSDE